MAHEDVQMDGPKGGGEEEPSRASARILVRLAVLALSGAVPFAVLAGWLQPLPWLLVPASIGVYVGTLVRKPRVAVAVAASAAVIGGLAAAALYRPEHVAAFVAAVPAWMRVSVPDEVLTRVVQRQLAMSTWAAQPAPATVIGAFVAAAAALATSWLASVAARPRLVRTTASWLVVVVLAASFLYSTDTYVRPLASNVANEPLAGTYGYDAVVYLKTFDIMKRGVGYYPAVVEAASGDGRFIASGAVRDGKMYGFWPKPSYFRQPLPFYLWTMTAKDAGGIVRLSQVLCALLLVALYAGAARRLSTRALLVPMMVFPWLLMHTTWLNVFFPDWWAALASMFALALLMGGVPVAAVVAALIAALMRFNALPLLVALAGASVFLAATTRRRRFVAATVAVAAAALVFGLSWQAHIAAATPFVDAATMQKTTTGDVLQTAAGQSLSLRAMSPASYLMFPYALLGLPLIAALPLASLGFAAGLRKDRFAQLALGLFAAGWLAFLLIVGTTCDYWGQVFTGITLVGTTVLIGEVPWIDSAWREVATRFQARSEPLEAPLMAEEAS